MQRPSNYDETPVNNYEALTEGGHKCVIKQIKEEKSAKGNDMVVIYFDTDNSDKQPGFFMNRYLNDKKPDKTWPGIYRITMGYDWSVKTLKSFITAVEDSNDGFQESPGMWANLDMALRNKKVGIVFRKEYYNDQATHELRCSVKPAWCRKYSTIENEPVPEPKNAPKAQPQMPTPTMDWQTVPEGLEDEGLPFN